MCRWSPNRPCRPKQARKSSQPGAEIASPKYSKFGRCVRAARAQSGDYLAGCNCLTALMMRIAAERTSAAVVVAPKLNRIALRTMLSGSPIATSVGDGSLDPLAQAEPVEQATPAKSRAITNACRSRGGKLMQSVCGVRAMSPPMTTEFGISCWILACN